MDYLVREGYPRAAQRFAVEANIQSDANLDSIQERVEIRNLIYAGDVETALARINSPLGNDYTSFMHHSYTSSVDER